MPSCWVGGDSCCVFGYDNRDEIPGHRGDWVLEIYSCALPGQLKAWWVPPRAIRGAWHGDEFIAVTDLSGAALPLLAPTGCCDCELSSLTAEQVRAWQSVTDG